GLVARDEQVDQDHGEGSIFEDDVAREGVLHGVPDQAAVDVAGEEQHHGECAFVNDQVQRQRRNRPRQERDDLPDEKRERESAPRRDGHPVDPEASVRGEERDREDPQQLQDRVEVQRDYDEVRAEDDHHEHDFLQDDVAALLLVAQAQVVEARRDHKTGAKERGYGRVLPQLDVG